MRGPRGAALRCVGLAAPEGLEASKGGTRGALRNWPDCYRPAVSSLVAVYGNTAVQRRALGPRACRGPKWPHWAPRPTLLTAKGKLVHLEEVGFQLE